MTREAFYTFCHVCNRPRPELMDCEDCQKEACAGCLGFAEMPGYPLCENCALAREEQEHVSTKAPPHSAPDSKSSEEV